ncbi:MAG: lipase family protein [Lawsonella sp.]
MSIIGKKIVAIGATLTLAVSGLASVNVHNAAPAHAAPDYNADGTLSNKNLPIWDHTPLPSFYRLSPQQQAKPHGTLIRWDKQWSPYKTRSVHRLVFSSRDSFNRPITGSAALILPKQPTKVKGYAKTGAYTPIVVINDMINSLGTRCQPSFALTSNDNEHRSQNKRVYEEAEDYIVRGWAVLIPDFLGMFGEYGANIMSGRIVLDAIAAATNTKAFGLYNSRAIVTGYSGGGMASMYAAAQQPTYAPGSNLLAVAAGGTPVDLPWMVDFFSKLGPIPNPVFGYGTGVLMGLQREYGERIRVYDRLTENGKKVFRASRSLCHDEMLEASSGESFPSMFAVDDIASSPDILAAGKANSLTYYAPIPKVPLYIYGAYTDIAVPLSLMEKVVNRYRSKTPSLPIWFRPQLGPNHMDAFNQAQPEIQQWMKNLFAGKKAPSNP